MFQRRNQRPMPGQARIVTFRLPAAVIERAHGAKFDDRKRLLVEAIAALHEKDRSRTIEPDQNRDQHKERRRQNERCRRENKIEHPLLQDFEARQRPARELQEW